MSSFPNMGGDLFHIILQLLYIFEMFRHTCRLLSSFAKKKEIIVKNFFTQAELGKYTSMNNSELQAFVEQSKACKKKWVEVPLEERQKIMVQFHGQLQRNSQRMSSLLSQCTGKQLQECESQTRVALKIFKKHLNDQFVTPSRTYINSEKQLRDYYEFEPFDHFLAVFDHRNPILSAAKYLAMALYSGSYVVLRPSYTVLPALKVLEEAWKSVSQHPSFTVLPDPKLDPKHDDSPIPKLLASTDGFVSFDGRMKDGFDFHYFMTQNSTSLRESQFMLTSSDSAYVMADLSAQQLQKAAHIIARGSFSNCGHNFNSIKRIFIDREIGEAFMERLVAEAQVYTVAESFSDLNKGLLAPFVNEEELKEGMEQLKALKEKYGDQMKHISGGEYVEVKAAGKTLKFLTPAIFEVTADFPNYNYQNEEFMLPICFVSMVDSASDCIERINSSIFGATASLFTNETTLGKLEIIGKRLDVGTINVNTWEVTEGITYSGRKRSGKGFSFSPLSYHNIVRSRAVSFNN